MNDYVCWSAPVDDLTDWRYEGVIYRKTDDPLNPDGSMCLYAPDVTVGPDGRYYLFYVLDKVSIVSVAVCDKPRASTSSTAMCVILTEPGWAKGKAISPSSIRVC